MIKRSRRYPLRLIFLLALLILALGTSPLRAAPAKQGPRPPVKPEPRPPLPPAAGDDDRDDHDEDSGPQSAILGTVTDLSLMQPGAGIPISVSGAVVTTDHEGHYSITGLGAGDYTLSLQLPGEWTAAQAPILVHLDGQNRATLDLAYYSQPPPPASSPPPPTVLPESGGVRLDGFVVLGLCFMIGGGFLRCRLCRRASPGQRRPDFDLR